VKKCALAVLVLQKVQILQKLQFRDFCKNLQVACRNCRFPFRDLQFCSWGMTGFSVHNVKNCICRENAKNYALPRQPTKQVGILESVL